MKQQNKQRYLIRYLSIFAILISIVIVKTSCTKLDVNYQSNQVHPPNFVEQFFSTKTTPTPAVANLIQKLKDENERTGFVNNLPKNCGLPIWEKVVMRKQHNHNEDNSLYSPASHGPSANFTTTEDSTEVDVIPLTLTDSSLSSIIIYKEQNGVTSTECKTANGDLYSFVTDPNSNPTLATEQLHLFFYMENETFDKSTFYHIPTNTFPQSTELGSDSLKIIRMSDNTNTNTDSSSFRFCKKYYILCQECHQYPCVAGQSYEYEICVTIDPPQGGGGGTGTGGTGTGGTGGTGGGGGGGTGTGGGGTGTGTGCNDPFYSFGPCGPPPPPPPPPTPNNDSLIKEMLRQENEALKTTRDSVWNLAMTNKWEYFFYFAKLSNQSPIQIKGIKTDNDEYAVTGDLKTVTGWVRVGTYHTHQDTMPVAYRHPHDPADIKSLTAKHNLIQNYRSYVDCGDTLYVVVIENVAKVKLFLEDHDLDDIHENEYSIAMFNAGHQNFRSKGLELLKLLLGSSSESGLGLYKSTNTDKTIFTKLN